MEKSFEEWFDAFCEFVRGFGYQRAIDRDSFIEEWEAGKDAYVAAEEFVSLMNS